MENNIDEDALTLDEFAGGIFDNKEAIVENIKSAAENVGLPPEAVEGIGIEEPKKAYYARRNCTWCCGRGMIKFVPNGVFVPARKTEPSKAFLRAVKMTRRKLGTSMQRLSLLANGKSRMGRDTCLPEKVKDGEWREENMTNVLCKCVKIVEEE